MIDNTADDVFEDIFEDNQTQQKIDEIAKKSGMSSILVMKSHDNEMEVVLSGGDAGKTYLGVPIEKNGKVVGTVCALNNESINFENEQYNVLTQLQKVKDDIESKF